MSKIIDIKDKLELKKEWHSYNTHDAALSACEEILPNGVIIISIADDGVVEMSANIEDSDQLLEMLVSCAVSIKEGSKE